MNDDKLKQLFQQTSAAKPDDKRRRDNIEMAKAAFLEAQSDASEKNSNSRQGITDLHRPKETNGQLESETMSTWNKWMNPGFAAAATLVMAVGLGYSLLVPNIVYQPEVVPSNDEADYANLSPRTVVSEEGQSSQISLPSPQRQAPLSDLLEAAKSGKLVNQANQRREQEFVAQQSALRTAESKMASAPAYEKDFSLVDRQWANEFTSFDVNPVYSTATDPVSTFSIDVDTASYSYVRRQLQQGRLPEPDSVRLEEMVNYFPYEYATPTSKDVPFEISTTVVDAPWNVNNKLIHIGVQGFELGAEETIQSNIVFLLDVSGSMNQPTKLPLVKQSMSLLLSKLNPTDTVSIVVYAGAAGVVLEPTAASEKRKILDALHRLQAGGATSGAKGIELAYQVAESAFIKNGVNRVFLATDGDFNVGISDPELLEQFIARKRDSGVYLSVLGFGDGNLSDATMQSLAQNGNGIAAYIDTLGEAQKVLVEESVSQLFPIANDVKIQVEFNPATVSEYRLLGYETRQLNQEDFNNDKVDAGEVGSGHSVTAIYEVTPLGSKGLLEPSRYQSTTNADSAANEYGFLKLRYKQPGETNSQLIEEPIGRASGKGNLDTNFAISVAGFAQLLTGGKHTGQWSYDDALALAQANRGEDEYGYRAEFVQLIRQAMVANEW